LGQFFALKKTLFYLLPVAADEIPREYCISSSQPSDKQYNVTVEIDASGFL